jgi:hypothetical protein
MITFKCPRCQTSIDALEGRATVACEQCGEIATVPTNSEVDTLTFAEIKALRDRLPVDQPSAPPPPGCAGTP